MTLTLIGWAVLHSLWAGTLLGGLTALVLSVIPDKRAPVRHVLAYVSLLLMVMVPAAMAIAGADPLSRSVREPVMVALDDTVGMPAIVAWRAVVVPGAALAWLAGVCVCLLRVAREWRRASRLAQRGLSDAAESVHRLVADLRAQLPLRTVVSVHHSRLAGVPMVLGWLRPSILLPAHVTDGLSDRQLRAILAHELAHVRRRDYLANVIQIAAESLLFHHPAARWVSRRVRTEREYCCDDVAVGVGSDPADYARALAELDDAREDCRLAVAAASGTLLDRIQRIAGHPRRVLTPARGAAVLAVTAVLAALMLVLTAVVPPGLPLDVKMRTRWNGPGPPPPPAGPALPRQSR